MGVKRRVNEKKYFRVIYFWILTLIAVLLLAFSLTVYINSRKTILTSTYEMNQQIATGIQLNIEQSDENVRSTCASLYVNPIVNRMMHTTLDEDDIYNWISDFQKIAKPLMSSNKAIHSIYVYNPEMEMYFSTYRHFYYQDESMDAVFSQGDVPPILTPIARKIQLAGGEEDRVISYVLYEDLKENGMPEGAVIVNVSTDWMEGNIRLLGELEEAGESNIVIFDGAENLVADTLLSTDPNEESTLEFSREIIRKHSNDGFYMETSELNAKKYVTFHNRTDDWNIIKIQAYEEVFQYLTEIRTSIVILTLLFCALFSAAAYYISNHLYRPIGSLVSKVHVAHAKERHPANEMAMLNEVYDTLLDQVKDFDRQTNEVESIVSSYHLRNFLINSESTDLTLLRQKSPVLDAFIESAGVYLLCLLAVDDLYLFQSKYSKNDQELFQYALMNIVEELVGQDYLSVPISLDNGKWVLLLKSSNPDTLDVSLLNHVFSEAIGYFEKYFQLSFSVSISSAEQDILRVTKAYHETQNNLIYRFILGKSAVICPEQVVENNQNTSSDMPETLLRALEKALEVGEKEALLKALGNAHEFVSGLSQQHLVPALMTFVLHTMNLAVRADETLLERENLQFLDLYHNVIEMETCNEVFGKLEILLTSAIDKQLISDPINLMVVDTVKDIIGKEYAREDLTLQELADLLGLSVQYLGRLFREEAGLSAAAYINEVRMIRAAELLLTEKYSVREVKKQVGIESEQQFYRLFKRKYNLTPRQFVLQQNLQQIEEDDK